jgi:Ca2+-binding RTX toxin-like protein
MTDANGATTDLDQVTNIEHLILGNAMTGIVTVDALVAAGATLEVNASALTGANSLFWDGIAEIDGMFSVIGGQAGDTIRTGSMGDTVRSGDGSDIVITGFGADSLFGGAGNDVLDAGFGVVGDGNNFLDGGAGMDYLAGGDAQDIFYFGIGESGATQATADSVFAFDGLEDTLVFQGGAAGSGTNYFENGVVAATYAAALAAANLDFSNVAALNYVVVEVTSFSGGVANDLVVFYNGGAGSAVSSVILEDIPLTGIGFADIAAG